MGGPEVDAEGVGVGGVRVRGVGGGGVGGQVSFGKRQVSIGNRQAGTLSGLRFKRKIGKRFVSVAKEIQSPLKMPG